MTSIDDNDIGIDDEKLWHKVTKTIKAFKRSGKIVPNGASSKSHGEAKQSNKIAPSNEPSRYEISSLDLFMRDSGVKQFRQKSAESLPGLVGRDQSGVDKNTARKLITGKFKIEAVLDLHGYYQEAALDALINFINNAFVAQYRCVLVITGKSNREGNASILKSMLPNWLNLPHVRDKIVMYSKAQRKDGGGGAFYVLLKRKRAL